MSIPTLDTRVKRFLVVGSCFLLGATAHADVSKRLRDGLSASSPKVRIVAVSAVARSKDPSARALLEPMLRDSDAAVRAAVIAGLGNLGDPAAVPALEALRDDDDTVKAVLARVLPKLEALRVHVYIGTGEDKSGAGIGDLAQLLAEKTEASVRQRLGPAFDVHHDPSKESFGAASLIIRSIDQHADGGNTFVDVQCELTLVEMPKRTLRGALASTASVGVAGPVSKKLMAELAHDGVNACAPELADDFVSYIRQHARR